MTADDILRHLHQIAQTSPVVTNAVLLAQARAERDHWRSEYEKLSASQPLPGGAELRHSEDSTAAQSEHDTPTTVRHADTTPPSATEPDASVDRRLGMPA